MATAHTHPFDSVTSTDTMEVASPVCPDHYKSGGLEAIEVMRAFLSREQFIGYLRGNVLKYELRLDKKGKALEDQMKALKYAEWLADELAINGTSGW